jgi:hypothetical protein
MDRTMTNGIVNEPSSHSVDETVERLKRYCKPRVQCYLD